MSDEKTKDFFKAMYEMVAAAIDADYVVKSVTFNKKGDDDSDTEWSPGDVSAMTLNKYQEKAMETCLMESNNFSYMMLNLVGEVGELSSKVAKSIRKKECNIGHFGENHICIRDHKLLENLMLEAGDILWQLSGLCTQLGFSLQEVADANLAKLYARKVEGTIAGDGDGATQLEGRTK